MNDGTITNKSRSGLPREASFSFATQLLELEESLLKHIGNEQSILNSLISMATGIVRVERGCLALYDREIGTFVVKSCRDLHGTSEYATGRKFSHELTETLNSLKEIIHVPSVDEDDARSRLINEIISIHGETEFIIPLVEGNKIAGVVILGKRLAGSEIVEEEIRLLNVMSHHMASFITTSKLFASLRGGLSILHSEREKLKTVMSSTDDGEILIGSEGEVMLFNQAALAIFATKRGQPLTRKVIASTEWFPFNSIIETSVKEGKAFSSEATTDYVPPRTFGIRAVPLDSKLGKKNVLITLTDLTRRMEIKRAKEDLITVISHELRTPLTLIKIFISNIASGIFGDIDDRFSIEVRRADAGADRLASLIDKLVDFANLARGDIIITPRRSSMTDIINDAVKSFEPVIESRKKQLSLDIRMHDSQVFLDSRRITQVIFHLLDNAIKFTGADGNISISASDTHGFINICVKDNGFGIPVDIQKDIFQSFRQPGRRDGPGAMGIGIGLALCKKIIEEHGGSIWVESTPGEGSSFYIKLPRKMEEKEIVDRPRLR